MLGERADTVAESGPRLRANGRDGDVICRTLASAGLRPRAAERLPGFLDELERAAAAVVAEEGLLHADRGPLAEWVARQAPWSDFPFILLTLRGNGGSTHTPI